MNIWFFFQSVIIHTSLREVIEMLVRNLKRFSLPGRIHFVRVVTNDKYRVLIPMLGDPPLEISRYQRLLLGDLTRDLSMPEPKLRRHFADIVSTIKGQIENQNGNYSTYTHELFMECGAIAHQLFSRLRNYDAFVKRRNLAWLLSNGTLWSRENEVLNTKARGSNTDDGDTSDADIVGEDGPDVGSGGDGNNIGSGHARKRRYILGGSNIRLKSRRCEYYIYWLA